MSVFFVAKAHYKTSHEIRNNYLRCFLMALGGCNADKNPLAPPQILELRAVTVANNGSAQLLGRILVDEGTEIPFPAHSYQNRHYADLSSPRRLAV